MAYLSEFQSFKPFKQFKTFEDGLEDARLFRSC